LVTLASPPNSDIIYMGSLPCRPQICQILLSEFVQPQLQKRSGHRLTVLQIPATLPTSVHQKLFQVTSTVYLALNMKLHLLCRHVGLGMDALKDEGFRLCKHCQFAKRKRYTGVRHDATIEGKGKKGDA
jgi:hypothetical protein